MHCLITGASSGIGEGLARYAATQGWTLTLAARRADALERLAGELAVDSFVRPTDVSDLDDLAALVGEAEARLGPIDVLVNNAGVQYVEPTLGVSVERLRRLIDIDLTAPLALIALVGPGMKARGRGTIVNIASMAGIIHTPGMCHYNGAKAGLAAASESLRVELRPSGVHVVTVYPGPVTTPMEQAARASYGDSAAVRYVPTGTTEGLAKLVVAAVTKRRARVVYPRVYGITRPFRITAQWITDRVTPRLAP
jgi:short-subunit dehydrogenase